jgi:hypothetical protein
MVNSKVQLVNVWWSTWLLTTSEGSIFATMKKVHAFHACHSCQVTQRKKIGSWRVRQSTYLLHLMMVLVESYACCCCCCCGYLSQNELWMGEGKGNTPLLEIFLPST